jgi:hypothetical protein
MTDARSATLERLEDQIAWYDRRSAQNRRRFKLVKAVQMIAAGAIPVLAATDAPNEVAASLGGAVVVLEGFTQLNQYQQNWITYRSTAEALKHEKYLHAAGADLYGDSPDPIRLLAERIEGLISQEHATWVSLRRRLAETEESTQ